jgi:hypothetical protein
LGAGGRPSCRFEREIRWRRCGHRPSHFVVRWWGEHLHQHYTRLTGQDLVIEQAVENLVDHEPVSHHLIAVRDVD